MTLYYLVHGELAAVLSRMMYAGEPRVLPGRYARRLIRLPSYACTYIFLAVLENGEYRAQWKRAAELLLGEADEADISKAIELALF